MVYNEIIIPNYLLERKLSNHAFAIAVALYNYNVTVEQTNCHSMFSVIYSPKHLARLCRLSTDATRKHFGELNDTGIIAKISKTKRGYTQYHLKRFEHITKNYMTLSKELYDAIEPELLQAYLMVRYYNNHNVNINALDIKLIGLRKLITRGFIAPRGESYIIIKGE